MPVLTWYCMYGGPALSPLILRDNWEQCTDKNAACAEKTGIYHLKTSGGINRYFLLFQLWVVYLTDQEIMVRFYIYFFSFLKTLNDNSLPLPLIPFSAGASSGSSATRRMWGGSDDSKIFAWHAMCAVCVLYLVTFHIQCRNKIRFFFFFYPIIFTRRDKLFTLKTQLSMGVLTMSCALLASSWTPTIHLFYYPFSIPSVQLLLVSHPSV